MHVRHWLVVLIAFATIAGAALLVMPSRRMLPAASEPAVARVPRSPAASLGIPASSAEGFCHQLYRTICGKRGETRDPTGAVRPDVDGELQALRTYEEIIRFHPEWSREQVDEELVRLIYTPKRRARITGAYQWVRGTMERYIDRQDALVFTAAEKLKLKKRIRGTELQLPPSAAIYADEPDLFTKNDVFYERTSDGRTRMRVGGAYVLNAKSWFNLVFTLAHEFAHAIDPCELKSAGILIPAYGNLSSCFMNEGMVEARPDRQECGDNDQLSETFADWLAVHVVSEALRAFATEFKGPQLTAAATNAVRDLCEQDEGGELDFQLHPPPQIRIERIFGRNPTVREVLACDAPSAPPIPAAAAVPYCDFGYRRP